MDGRDLERDVAVDVTTLISELKADAGGEAALKLFSETVKTWVQKTNERIKFVQGASFDPAQAVADLSSFLQDAFRDVDALVNSDANWQQRSERERSVAVEAAEMYLNRLVFDLVFCTEAETARVDGRLTRLLDGLAFVELRHFRMPAYLVTAIQNNTSHFAAAVAALYSLQDRHNEGGKFPRDKMRCLALFYNHLVKLIASEGGQGNADELMDVALYTLLVVKPSGLYGTLRYIERFRWLPFATAGFSGFLLGWVESLIATVYTIDTTHFEIERDVFLAHLMSSGFEAAEFEPRPRGTPLPPPFGRGPQLGFTAASDAAPAPARSAQDPGTPAAGADPGAAPRAAEVSSSAADGEGEHPRRGRSRSHSRQRGNAPATEETTSSGTPFPNSIAELEAAGGEKLRSARMLQHLHRQYPFLQQQAQDLFLKDVGELLSQYQDMAIRYESLRAGLKKFGVK